MTLGERFKALYDKIEGEKIRYDLNREGTKISSSSSVPPDKYK